MWTPSVCVRRRETEEQIRADEERSEGTRERDWQTCVHPHHRQVSTIMTPVLTHFLPRCVFIPPAWSYLQYILFGGLSSCRQLEAVVRIAESLAKIKLQPIAGEEEVDEALRLFQVSTLDAAMSGSLSGECDGLSGRE